MNNLDKAAHLDLHLPTIQSGHMYVRFWSTTPRWGVTCFIKNLGYVLVVLNLSIPEIISVDNSMMTSS